MESWIEAETTGCTLLDERLKTRLRTLLSSMSQHVGEPLPLACQDWAATKAAYRFFDNENVDESAILAGHFEATRVRCQACSDAVLVLHDTTEFSYTRNSKEAIGITKVSFGGWDKDGRPRLHTLCGLLLHSSLAVTQEGLPLGLTAAKFWTRKKFKGTNAQRRKVNGTRVPIEQKESLRWIDNMKQTAALVGDPARCVHIGDRESDIYELFCAAKELGTHFLARSSVNRLAGGRGSTLLAEIERAPVLGHHRIDIEDAERNTIRVKLQIQISRLTLHPPIGKHKRYPSLEVTFIRAREESEPKGRERIDWKLMTDLPVSGLPEAIEKLNWYSMRWKIETFHKILKSGCRAEESKLRTAQRLANLLALMCIVSWRVYWLCMVKRAMPDAPATLALTATELDLLERLTHRRKSLRPPTISECVIGIAKLGGYLARASDAPPGNMVLWRGLTRLTDIHLGYSLAQTQILVGN